MKASNLREVRRRKKLTQDQLAAKAGVSQTVISQLETGLTVNPTIGVVTKLETALGLKRGGLIFPSDLSEAS